MELNVLVIDKDKNTIQLDLMENEYNLIFSDKIDTTKIKKHENIKTLDLEVRNFLKNIRKKESKSNEE